MINKMRVLLIVKFMVLFRVWSVAFAAPYITKSMHLKSAQDVIEVEYPQGFSYEVDTQIKHFIDLQVKTYSYPSLEESPKEECDEE